MTQRIIQFHECGRLSYAAGLARQEAAHTEVIQNGVPQLLSLEHDPVFTLGRRTAENQFRAAGAGSIPVIKTDRGGEVTYHGPGQSVVYCIFPLDQMRLTLPRLVGALESAVIDRALSLGVTALAKPSWRGVFVGDLKLASIGLAVHHGVTQHGIALNVENDLAAFERINPCGLSIEMTSLARLGVHHAGRSREGWHFAEMLAQKLGFSLRQDAKKTSNNK